VTLEEVRSIEEVSLEEVSFQEALTVEDGSLEEVGNVEFHDKVEFLEMENSTTK